MLWVHYIGRLVARRIGGGPARVGAGPRRLAPSRLAGNREVRLAARLAGRWQEAAQVSRRGPIRVSDLACSSLLSAGGRGLGSIQSRPPVFPLDDSRDSKTAVIGFSRALGGWWLLAAVWFGGLAGNSLAQTTPGNPSPAAASPPASAEESAKSESRYTGRGARYAPPPPRPQTFQTRSGLRAWDHDGQQRLREARNRLWNAANGARERQQGPHQRLVPGAGEEEAPGQEPAQPERN
jgi:hypothetical protein